jgi:4-hydroxy-3-methylbut-2-enyl diphosphate reductase
MPILCYAVKPRGFCSGVSRAVKMLDQVLKLYDTVYIIEDIIHNKCFMKKALETGVVKVSSIEEVPKNSAVMFSSHGTSAPVLAEAEKKGLIVIDATCPFVKELHQKVVASVEDGKKIVIIGNRAHPEITALLGSIPSSNAFVVSNEVDIDILPDLSNDAVMYYTQTTLDIYTISGVIAALKKKVPHITSSGETNICTATRDRQAVVHEVSKLVELVLVVGSCYSSNTSRLVDVAKEALVPQVYLVDNENDILLSWFDEVKSFAVTSGASVPDSVVESVFSFLKANLDLVIKDFSIKISEPA